MGETSVIMVISRSHALSARMADSLPAPGPFTKTSTLATNCPAVIREGVRLPPDSTVRAERKSPNTACNFAKKQKTKRIYGVQEGQFRQYYETADRMKGITGENMLSLLERRLDNVIYRMGIGASRAQARQLVNHAHFSVNGRTVNIPSYIVKAGDVIAVKENRKNTKYFEQIKTMKVGNMPKWLEFDPEKLEGKILALPVREDIDRQMRRAYDCRAVFQVIGIPLIFRR